MFSLKSHGFGWTPYFRCFPHGPPWPPMAPHGPPMAPHGALAAPHRVGSWAQPPAASAAAPAPGDRSRGRPPGRRTPLAAPPDDWWRVGRFISIRIAKIHMLMVTYVLSIFRSIDLCIHIYPYAYVTTSVLFCWCQTLSVSSVRKDRKNDNQGSGSKINKSVRTLRRKLPFKKYEIETTWKRKVVLHTYAYIYMCVCVCAYLYLYLFISIYIYISIYLSIYLSI